MLIFAADENFNRDIVRGLRRRSPAIDIAVVQDEGMSGVDDPGILDWAANLNRILLTHDVSTITRFAYDRVDANLPMPGVVEVGRHVSTRIAIEDILILAECSLPDEWRGQIVYLPLR